MLNKKTLGIIFAAFVIIAAVAGAKTFAATTAKRSAGLFVFSFNWGDMSLVPTSINFSGVDVQGKKLPSPCALFSPYCNNMTMFPFSPIYATGTYTISITGGTPSGYVMKDIQAMVQNTVLDPTFHIGSTTETAYPINNVDTSSPGFGSGPLWYILWDPLAAFQLTPQYFNFTSSTLSGTLNVTNVGTHGSRLSWSDSIKYVEIGLPNWLSISHDDNHTIDPIGLAVGNKDVLTVTANPAGLPNGIYHAEIDFTGVSLPDSQTIPDPPPVTVTLLVGNGGSGPVCGNGVVESGEQCDNGAQNGICPAACSASCQVQSCAPQPTCTFTANPTLLTPPQSSALSYNCKYVSSCALAGGQFGAGQPVNVNLANFTAKGKKTVAPPVSTTYILSCYGEQTPVGSNPNYYSSVQVQIQVNNMPTRQEIGPQ